MTSALMVSEECSAARWSELLGGDRPLNFVQRYQLAALVATIAGSVARISEVEEPDPAYAVACWAPVLTEYEELLATAS